MNQEIFEGGMAAAPRTYQRYFVPAIGGPVAEDLMAIADIHPGEHVLDVACGTGVVTRLAAERVGASGSVAGLDVNPGMLAVAGAETPPGMAIDWREASAEAMPFPDEEFDVALCQMGLQFVPDKSAALREMRRVIKKKGRAYVTVPGPKPALFAIMTSALERHIGPEAASFGDIVFSMHDADALRQLMVDAGFENVEVQQKPKSLRLPAPADFLWQYIYSTPLAQVADQAGEEKRKVLERDICTQWDAFVVDGTMPFQVGMTTAFGVR